MISAFDSDVLIYAADPDNPLGRRVAALFSGATSTLTAGVGSVLLLPEVLSRPQRQGSTEELLRLGALLTRLDLYPVDQATADLATTVAATYRLHCADAVHLATAIAAGADCFITNNRRDFGRPISEVDVVFPEDLPDPEN